MLKTHLALATWLLFAFSCTKLQELPSTTADAESPLPMGGNGEAGQGPLGGSGGVGGEIVAPDGAAPPPCQPGSIGCSCTGGQCDKGLNCQADACVSATCGDGKQDEGEACDKGAENNDTAYDGCTKQCVPGPHCGDAIKNGAEGCDDGNKDDSDLCSNKCEACVGRAGFLACGERCLAGVSCCSGQACGAAACAGNLFSAARICDGAGKCPATITADCGSGFACDGNLCRSQCSTDSHCAGGRTCSNGACVLKGCGNGAIEAPETCEDGNNVDDDGCSNGCVKCSNRSGYRECMVGGGIKCLANAECCPGATCRPEGCAGVNQTAAQTCSATGQCPVGTGTACANNLVCEGTGCRTSCTTNGHCLNGRVCYNGACIIPSCGNGMVEPGESCDNGNSNADSATCGTDCKTCSARGRKQCDGVCLTASQCCADADCPAATTTGVCNVPTKQCWKRATVKFAVRNSGTATPLGIFSSSGPLKLGGTWGLLRFHTSLPPGAVVEAAVLTLHKLSSKGAVSDMVLRVMPCVIPDDDDSTERFQFCGSAVTADSPLLSPDNNYGTTYSADLTTEIRSGQNDFAVGVFFSPMAAGIDFYGKDTGKFEPALQVTYTSF